MRFWIAALWLLAGCSFEIPGKIDIYVHGDGDPDDPPPVSDGEFSKVYEAVLKPYCAQCHIDAARGGVSLKNYDDVMEHVKAGDAENSQLYFQVRNDLMPLPPNSPVPADKKAVLKKWIDDGAKQ